MCHTHTLSAFFSYFCSMIRIAIIGFGQRGQATFARLQHIKNAEVVMLCDTNRKAMDNLEPEKRKGVICTTDYHEVTQTDDLHLIYICTPWDMHVDIAVEAMNHGKHVAIEVPAAMTVDECEMLVRVSKWTERHCVMLENCCYDTWHLGIREMVQQGLLGRVTHLEGAYIHPVESNWMEKHRKSHKGNPYPTHGLGPMCQLLDADDNLQSLVSMSSTDSEKGFHINNTLLQTRKGVSMLLQYDTSTPRPYSRLQTVCGTNGYAQKYPLPTIQIKDTDVCCKRKEAEGAAGGEATMSSDETTEKLLVGAEATAYVESYIPPVFQQLIEDGKRLGVANIMNYMMDRRLIDGLESGQTHLDMEVHEAALWSSLTELTERSVILGNKKIEIPDF